MKSFEKRTGTRLNITARVRPQPDCTPTPHSLFLFFFDSLVCAAVCLRVHVCHPQSPAFRIDKRWGFLRGGILHLRLLWPMRREKTQDPALLLLRSGSLSCRRAQGLSWWRRPCETRPWTSTDNSSQNARGASRFLRQLQPHILLPRCKQRRRQRRQVTFPLLKPMGRGSRRTAGCVDAAARDTSLSSGTRRT